MRLYSMGRTSLMLLVVSAAACGERTSYQFVSPSPIGITPGSTPEATAIAITGRIDETAPTKTTGVPGATVRITDGQNANQSTTTDRYGFYQLNGLQPGRFTLAVHAEGFVDRSEAVTAYANTTINLDLTPIEEMMSHTSTGTIAATDAHDGTCSDGVALRACRILMVPVHNAGPVAAKLTWVGDKDADLDLTLFQTGVTSPLARSNASGATPEAVAASVPGGATYEFRVTWAAGHGGARYVLEVSYPY